MNNFVVLGTQRTGSSAISKLINLHPHILCGLEWTSGTPTIKKVKTAKKILSCSVELLKALHMETENIQKKDTQRIRWVGFKILFSSSDKWMIHPKYSIALWIDQLNSHLNWLKSCQNIRVIHIVRNNNMDWLKSVFLAKTTKMFSGKTYPKKLKIKINERKALARIKAKRWVDDQISLLKFTNPYICVDYETFENNNHLTANNIMKFLNCDSNLLTYSNYNAIKQSKGHSKDYILNYFRLYRVLKRNDLL